MKRAYDDPEPDDGLRILVDRLWPRGVSKERLQLDEWLKELSPSGELRKKFHREPANFEEFKTDYFKELRERKELADRLRRQAREQTVTLIYAAKNEEQNNAVALKEFLEEKVNKSS
ncbi:MAG: DUF488 family protein [Balneolaceae bacterium]|nr:DUF488 family protein [Balneolaceae bacterium]